MEPSAPAHSSARNPSEGSILINARVSTGKRADLRKHVDTALLRHLGLPEVKRIYDLALLPGVMEKGQVGLEARNRIGWITVYAPGSRRELGILATDGRVQVLFLNASASARDLGSDSNAFVQVLKDVLSGPGFRGTDPHAPVAERPRVLVPFVDRLVRDQELGWELFNAARRAFVVFQVEDTEIDTLASDATDKWTMYAWQASQARVTNTRRLVNGELNLYRAGLYGGAEANLPRGFRFEQEPMPDGRWRRACDRDAKSRIDHRVEPDPEAWWEVALMIRTALDPAVITWRELGSRLGEGGLTSRGKDEEGTALNDLIDRGLAARLVLSYPKLHALKSGLIDVERVGPGQGVWSLPSGHVLTPRFPGDERGSVTYQVRLGSPAWPAGFSDDDVESVIAKWWPAGQPLTMPVGRRASTMPRRALAGLIGWTDGDDRFEVLAHSGGRYELRKQHLPTTRHGHDGQAADLRHETSVQVASWQERELSGHLASMIDEATVTLLGADPAARLRPAVAMHPRPARVDPFGHAAQVAKLNAAAERAERQALGAHAASNDCYSEGDLETGRRKLADARAFETEAADLHRRMSEMSTGPVADEPAEAAALLLDVATPATVVAALAGPFGAGAAPVELNTALRVLLAEDTRIVVGPGPMQVTMSIVVHYTLLDGTEVTVAVSRVIPAKLATVDADLRIDHLSRGYMRDGWTLAETAEAGRSRSPQKLLGAMSDFLGAGQRRPSPDKNGKTPAFTAKGARIPHLGLRSAAVNAPLLETRQGLWWALTGEKPPGRLPHGWRAHLTDTYMGGDFGGWQTGWAQQQTLSYRALAVLTSHPGLATGMRTDHLAACLQVRRRNLTLISTPTVLNGRQYQPTLHRVNAWGGKAACQVPAADKLVGVIRCPHAECGGDVDAVVVVPEVVAAGSSALCSKCLRAPTSGQVFPASYAGWALAQTAKHPGSWVRCGYPACTVDFGAGPGLMWQWADACGSVWHGADCRADRTSTTTPDGVPAPRLDRCAVPGCTVDIGHGPGVLAQSRYGKRLRHAGACARGGTKDIT